MPFELFACCSKETKPAPQTKKNQVKPIMVHRTLAKSKESGLSESKANLLASIGQDSREIRRRKLTNEINTRKLPQSKSEPAPRAKR